MSLLCAYVFVRVCVFVCAPVRVRALVRVTVRVRAFTFVLCSCMCVSACMCVPVFAVDKREYCSFLCSPDGTLWQPKEHTRICSRHFVGNSKSDVSQDPSYIPTIFPPVYRKKAPDQERAQRYERKIVRLPVEITDSCFEQCFVDLTWFMKSQSQHNMNNRCMGKYLVITFHGRFSCSLPDWY